MLLLCSCTLKETFKFQIETFHRFNCTAPSESPTNIRLHQAARLCQDKIWMEIQQTEMLRQTDYFSHSFILRPPVILQRGIVQESEQNGFVYYISTQHVAVHSPCISHFHFCSLRPSMLFVTQIK